MPLPIDEVVLGIYLGLLAGAFPGFVAFLLGFSFKYFTDVTVPGLGVVAMSGAIAGVSGGLMGLLDPQLADSWIGITAVIVILMISLWGHAIGDKLGTATPRHITLQRLKDSRLSADLVERVDTFGHLRIRPVGEIEDVMGYPPLPLDTREAIKAGSWTFPGELPRGEIERRLEERLLEEFELADVSVSIDERGRAQIVAAPATAGLSRRIPQGKRGVSINTLLPTGITREDRIAVQLDTDDVTGSVLSAFTFDIEEDTVDHLSSEQPEVSETPAPKAPTTTGGSGRVTVAVKPREAARVLKEHFAPIYVLPRGRQREFEGLAILSRGGNELSRVTIPADSTLVGTTLGTADLRERYGVEVLVITRGTTELVSPPSATEIAGDDRLTVVGPPGRVDGFREAVV